MRSPTPAIPPASPNGLGPGELSIESRAGADVLTILPRGELDLASGTAFEKAMRDAEAIPGRLVVDLSELGFIDSTGIHLLLQAQRRNGARLSLRRGKDAVQRVLTLTRVVDCFAFEEEPAAQQPDSRASQSRSQPTAIPGQSAAGP